MVPKCPICGGDMDMNLRKDQYFVQDEAWYEAEERCSDFLTDAMGENLVLLEVGVGFNTPTIIRFPFEKLAREHKNIQRTRCTRNRNRRRSGMCDPTVIKCIKCSSGKFGLSGFVQKSVPVAGQE